VHLLLSKIINLLLPFVMSYMVGCSNTRHKTQKMTCNCSVEAKRISGVIVLLFPVNVDVQW